VIYAGSVGVFAIEIVAGVGIRVIPRLYHTYMDITMPASFPMDEFRAFGFATIPFFPNMLSGDDLNDPLRRRSHCTASWQAVRYRYRLCSECNDEFRALVTNP